MMHQIQTTATIPLVAITTTTVFPFLPISFSLFMNNAKKNFNILYKSSPTSNRPQPGQATMKQGYS